MTGPCPALGFVVVMEPVHGLAPDAGVALHDQWVAFLEERGLYCGGGGAAEHLEYVVASEASQATESDRAATLGWLASRAELREWRVSDLDDLNAAPHD